MKDKICYILPFFDQKTDSHYYHLYSFINTAAKNIDIHVIIEKPTHDDINYFKNVNKISVQKFSFLPLRISENLFLIAKARYNGYKKFYIHYSYISAINAGIMNFLTKSKSWYWNCGMPWLFTKDKLNKMFLITSLYLSSYLVTGTEKLVNDYMQNYKISKSKIRIMPNWIQKKRFDINEDQQIIKQKYNISLDKKNVLFIHRIAPRKGSRNIINIAKELKNNTKIHFLIIGDGPDLIEIKKITKEFNLHNITFFGKIQNSKIPELMSIADVFCMPSEEEGFPRVLVEAMASGLPYTAADVGGVEDITPNILKKHIHKPKEYKKFAQSIEQIITKERHSFSDTLRDESNKYEEEFVIKKYFTKLFT